MSNKIWVRDQDGLGLYLCDNFVSQYERYNDEYGNNIRHYSIVTILSSGKNAILWEDEGLDQKEGIALANKRQHIINKLGEFSCCNEYASIEEIELQYDKEMEENEHAKIMNEALRNRTKDE